MKILVYPTDINPYQKMLYKALREKYDVKVIFLNGEKANFFAHFFGIFLFPYKLIFFKLLGFDILHIHWPSFNLPLINNLLFRYISTLNFLICLFSIKILNYKTVWTVHNLEPHEKMYLDDLYAIKKFSKLAKTKIVHAESTIQTMDEKGIDIENIFTIPHGNYSEAYKNSLSKSDARSLLDLNRKDYVILFFGQIRLYKDIESLLKALENIFLKHKNIKLLIAGKCNNNIQNNIISKYKNKYKNNIILDLRYIPDEEVEKYFKASDIVAYPFKKITTSGSVLLAITFGRSIIYPLLGALKDIPKNIGFAYNPKNPDGLEEAIEDSIINTDTLKEREKHSLKFNNSLSWDKIAEQTFTVYKSLYKTRS
jgi:beta-1,4-mannosyltransferase